MSDAKNVRLENREKKGDWNEWLWICETDEHGFHSSSAEVEMGDNVYALSASTYEFEEDHNPVGLGHAFFELKILEYRTLHGTGKTWVKVEIQALNRFKWFNEGVREIYHRKFYSYLLLRWVNA